MGFVCGFSAGHADAGVVGAAVDVQETFVFLTDLLLQVEGGFDQTMRRQRLYLRIGAWRTRVLRFSSQDMEGNLVKLNPQMVLHPMLLIRL